MSPDPIVQNPKDVQAYNRYAYVRNNPMTNIDPSGYSWIGDNKHRIGEAMVYQGMYISLTSGGNPYALLAGGLVTAGGQHLMGDTRGAAITAFVATASFGIGSLGPQGAGTLSSGEVVFAHSVVGGVAAELQGGKFHHGFLASAASSAAAPHVPENAWGGTFVSAMIGGTVSEITGGKFKNGAATSALQFLYNHHADHGGGGGSGVGGDGGETPSGAPISEAEIEMLKNGDIIGFWKSRHANGDPVARTALIGWGEAEHVGANAFEVAAAKHTWSDLEGYITKNKLTVTMDDIGLELASAHAMAVMGDSKGVAHLLSPQQVADYHHSVFAKHSIPPYLFGGTHQMGGHWYMPTVNVPVQGGWAPAMFSADSYSNLWCKGCDTSP